MDDRNSNVQAVAAPGVVLRRLRRVLEPKEAAQVTAGMELIEWDCTAELWGLHIDACTHFTSRSLPAGPAWGGGAMGAVGGAVIGGFFGLGFGPAGAALAATFGAAIGFAGVLSVVSMKENSPHAKAREIRAALTEQELPSVKITSNGVAFGPILRAWRSHIASLSDARIVDGLPPYLVLLFEPPDRLAYYAESHFELWLPVPSVLLVDARELAQMLRERWKKADGMRPEELVGRGTGTESE